MTRFLGRNPLLFIALVLILIVNGILLVHVQRNRSGTPDAEMELTARELSYYGTRTDDSSMMLQVMWQNTAPQYVYLGSDRPTDWFDLDKLNELGFDTSIPATGPEARRYYERQQARPIYVVLEYDGPSFQDWLVQRQAQQLEQLNSASFGGNESTRLNMVAQFERELSTASRLVSIDVGLDPDELRRSYPDRNQVLIWPALAKAVVDGPGTDRPTIVRGAITQLTIQNINVPAEFRTQFGPDQTLASWRPNGDPPPYSVMLRMGSLLEPWVVSVRPTE